MKSMLRAAVLKALRDHGCTLERQGAEHEVWVCGCDQKHKSFVPRHRAISPGVVRDTIKKMTCLPEGWLQ